MASSYKHRSGDRKDGRLLRSLPAYSKFMPYMVADKNEACNFYDESFDIGEADKCLRQERVSGYKNISFLHFIIAAYVRCVSMLPGINRFIRRYLFIQVGDKVGIVHAAFQMVILQLAENRRACIGIVERF